eukprot:gene32423-39208_t
MTWPFDLLLTVIAKRRLVSYCQRLRYKHVDTYAKLGAVCKQSVFDSIIDNQALDRLLETADVAAAMESIDHMQNSLRIGWIQELDGDPGAVAAWYRGHNTNSQATQSRFQELGLHMYVYTNAYNC